MLHTSRASEKWESVTAVQLDLLREERAADEIRHTHCLTWEQRAQFGKLLVKVSPKISGVLLCLQGPVKSSPWDSQPWGNSAFQDLLQAWNSAQHHQNVRRTFKECVGLEQQWLWLLFAFSMKLVPGRARAVLRHKHVPARTAPLLLIPSRAQQSH